VKGGSGGGREAVTKVWGSKGMTLSMRPPQAEARRQCGFCCAAVVTSNCGLRRPAGRHASGHLVENRGPSALSRRRGSRSRGTRLNGTGRKGNMEHRGSEACWSTGPPVRPVV
jgi:hypothetical protein